MKSKGRSRPEVPPRRDPNRLEDWPLRVIDWYRRHQRDLPWRRNADPYQIWLSEVMLQQTQVTTVLPYFERFVQAYPTLESLAAADETDVMDLWSGLGYYSRARNLLHSARRMVSEYGGRVPDALDDLLALPGIGRYSAGAIASIAFGRPHPVVDGNVKRVLARLRGIREGIPEKDLWLLLEQVVRDAPVAASIADFNQGLMELGAVICTPRSPRCRECPLADGCVAMREGTAESIPAPKRLPRTETRQFTIAVIRDEGDFLLYRDSLRPILNGFWEFPKVESDGNDDGDPCRRFAAELGLKLHLNSKLPQIRHQITFHRYLFSPFLASLEGPPPADQDGMPTYRWLQPGRKGCPVSAYVRKVIRLLS